MRVLQTFLACILALFSTCLAYSASEAGPVDLISNPPKRELKQMLDLSNYEKRVFSQFGEDGVIQKIMEVIGTTNKYYVEFGAVDGHWLSNTKRLREQEGWTGLLMDSSYEDLSLNLHREHITAENITHLFRKYKVPSEFDLLSIDLDLNDFYVWLALNPKYRPRLIIIECNGTYLAHEDKISVYEPYGWWDRTNYGGASALAMYKLGRKKGYSLIYAETHGSNLFFLRDDVVEECGVKFKYINNINKLYQTAKYGPGPNGGHGQDPYNRPLVSSDEFLK